MSSRHHVVYYPGLGDGEDAFQRRAMKFWRYFGFDVHFWPVGWADEEPFEHKFADMLKRIEELAVTGRVSLIGTSAGAAAALNVFAYAKDHIANVVTVCGKIQHIDKVGEHEYQNNPALRGGLGMLPKSLPMLDSADRQRILTIRPLTDRRVSPADAVLPGARQKTQYTFGHGLSIIHAITIGSPRLARFIKSVS